MAAVKRMAMTMPPAHPRDPLGPNLAITTIFLALAMFRLSTPSGPYFDESHYIPAARELLDRGLYLNREHPLFGKQLIAIGIAIFGDNPLGWRIPSVLAGGLALFASMRVMWLTSQSRFASFAFGILLASGFMLLVQSRIAMLDIFMASFLALAAWQFAGAIREPETGRWRLALTGIALGLAMGSKWNAIPLAVLPGIAFFAARLSAGRRRLFTSRRGIPVPGVSLIEAALWLGVVPLAVYALTFAPAHELRDTPFATMGFIDFQREMLALQMEPLEAHPYQSRWPEWVLNLRSIWYEYDLLDGAQRGVLLIGNPLTSLIALPALIWCAISGATKRDWVRLAPVIGYGASLGLWLVAAKSTQYFYHYFVPHFFLLSSLALALDALRKAGRSWIVYAVLAASVALLAYFYPVLTAAPLHGPEAFHRWTWLPGWI